MCSFDWTAGLECPDCGCPETPVVYTRYRRIRRDGKPASKVLRRRECDHCGKRFTSFEYVAGESV